MIKITLNYQDKEEPVIIEINDSSLSPEQEKLVVDCANTQMYGILYGREGIDPKYTETEEIQDIIDKYCAVFEAFDLWSGWIDEGEDDESPTGLFDNYTKVELV